MSISIYGHAKVDSLANYTSKNQIKIGYSYNPINKLYIGITTISLNKKNENASFSNLKLKKSVYEKNVGSIIFEYNRRIKKRFNFGVVMFVDLYNGKDLYSRNDSTFTIQNKTKGITIMPTAYFHYMKHKLIDLYLGGGLGMIIVNEQIINETTNGKLSETSILPAFNFCPLGIKLKTIVSPYLEVNIGTRGWIEGGVVINIK
jgi:hypothetical protein